MKRSILAVGLTVTLGASALVAAPSVSAAQCYTNGGGALYNCAEPTGVSVTASPSTVVISSSGTRAVALTAVFNDPADIVRSVDFNISLPDGTKRTAYASGYLSKSGTRETYRAVYNAYSFYAPGVYRVTAVAGRDSNKAQSFTTTPQVSGAFVVKHTATSTIYPSKYVFYRGDKLRFTGTVRNTTRPSGLKVTVQFKAKGKKKFKKIGKSVKSNAAGEWKSKKYRMVKTGKWRAKISGKGYVVGSYTNVLKGKVRSN